MAQPKKEDKAPVLIRLRPELLNHVERKVEAINKERKSRLEKPINRQDVIEEIIRQDAVKKSG